MRNEPWNDMEWRCTKNWKKKEEISKKIVRFSIWYKGNDTKNARKWKDMGYYINQDFLKKP